MKSCAGAGAAVSVVAGSEVEVEGSTTVRSLVVEGSTAGMALGIAAGVEMGPCPPAAMAAAELAGRVVVGALSSSSQSISSSAGAAARVLER